MASAEIFSEYLDMELMGRLESLQIRARFLVEGFMAGLHKTPFTGSSVEFKEYREYYPGDELKLLDWKAYARTDRLHIKLREEETNLTASLLIDNSASMAYRSKLAPMRKWDYACSLTAAFMMLLQKQRDSASLAFIGDELKAVSRPGSSSSSYHRMMVQLHREPSSSSSRIAECIREYLPLLRNRSLVLVFSDFYDNPKAIQQQLAFMRNRGCEVLLFHIFDPQEVDFEFQGPQVFHELEGGNKLELSPDLIGKVYRKKIRKHIDSLSKMCAETSCEYLLLRTDIAPLHALGSYLAKRKAMQ